MKKSASLGYVAVVVSLTLVMLILGLACSLMVGARDAKESLASNIGFSIILSDSITKVDMASIEKRLATQSSVKQWSYLSKDDAAAEFEEATGVEFRQSLPDNPIPASYELTLKGDSLSASSLGAMAVQIEKWHGVDQVIYGQKVVEQMASTFDSVNLLLLGFAGALLFVSIVLIYNTINLSIASEAQAIRTMKLVGATRSFIRRPYLVRSVVQGAFAGVFGAGALVLALKIVGDSLPMIRFQVPNTTLVAICAADVLVSIIICLIFTTVSVNKHINKR